MPSPTGSGAPILRPGILVPDHPLSMGLSFNLLNFVIESLSLISFSILKFYHINVYYTYFCTHKEEFIILLMGHALVIMPLHENQNIIPIKSHRSGSSGNFCCFRSSRPLITGAESPGHSILILPTPIT